VYRGTTFLASIFGFAIIYNAAPVLCAAAAAGRECWIKGAAF